MPRGAYILGDTQHPSCSGHGVGLADLPRSLSVSAGLLFLGFDILEPCGRSPVLSSCVLKSNKENKSGI